MNQKTTMDEVGVTFVNAVTNQGVFDGVFNINFATFLFTPTQETRVADDGKKLIDIEPELVMSCRLRMGEQCLRQLHDATARLIALVEESKVKQTNGVAEEVTEAPVGKPN